MPAADHRRSRRILLGAGRCRHGIRLRIATPRPKPPFSSRGAASPVCDMGACAILPRIIGQAGPPTAFHRPGDDRRRRGEMGFHNRLVAPERADGRGPADGAISRRWADLRAWHHQDPAHNELAVSLRRRSKWTHAQALHGVQGFPPRLRAFSERRTPDLRG